MVRIYLTLHTISSSYFPVTGYYLHERYCNFIAVLLHIMPITYSMVQMAQ